MSLARNIIRSQEAQAAKEAMLDVSAYYTGQATMESSWLDYAVTELNDDIHDALEAYYIADVMGEVKVIQEGADAEVLLEGILSSGFEKLKTGWNKFLAKLKEWFAKVKDYFKTFTLSGAKFTKEFGDQLRKKASSDEAKAFTYTGYKFTMEKGLNAGNAIFEGCEKYILKLINAVDSKKDELMSPVARSYQNKEQKEKAKEDIKNEVLGDDRNPRDTVNWDKNPSSGQVSAKSKTTYSVRDHVDGDSVKAAGGASHFIHFMKNLPADVNFGDKSATEVADEIVTRVYDAKSASEAMSKLKRQYRDTAESTTTLNFSTGNSVAEMIDIVESCKEAVQDAETKENRFEKDVKEIIDFVDKMANGQKNNDDLFKVASKISSYITAIMTQCKNVVDIEINAYKDFASQSNSVLKGFLRKGGVPTKEGMEPEDNGTEPISEGTDAGTGEENGDQQPVSEGASLFEMAYGYL